MDGASTYKRFTGYPDKYKNEAFFQSDRFLGAAWKPMPADLSQPRLANVYWI